MQNACLGIPDGIRQQIHDFGGGAYNIGEQWPMVPVYVWIKTDLSYSVPELTSIDTAAEVLNARNELIWF